jgi:hypothetical protein
MATTISTTSATFEQVLHYMGTCWTRNMPSAYNELVADLSSKQDSK